jgi:hypothetical protein
MELLICAVREDVEQQNNGGEDEQAHS